LLEITPQHLEAVQDSLAEHHVPHAMIGTFAAHARFTVRDGDDQLVDASLDNLREAWLGTLDW
jgi:phosphoribosylformylglycinamidine (FGAM) synthase-like enzyme